VRVEVQKVELSVGYAFSGLIILSKEPGADTQAGRGSSRTDIARRSFIAVERPAGPVFGDLGE